MKILKILLLIYFFTLPFSSDIVFADEQNLIYDSGMISELPYGLKPKSKLTTPGPETKIFRPKPYPKILLFA